MNRNMGVEEAVREYAKKLSDIYDNRLAGDYTFHGILYEFLVAVNGWVVKPTDEKLLEEDQPKWPVDAPHSRACGPYSHEHGDGCHPNCPTCGTNPNPIVSVKPDPLLLQVDRDGRREF